MRNLILGLALVLPAVALAVPTTLAHQGRLVDAEGVPLDGQHSVRFTIYDSATAGSPLWTETLTVTVNDGFFSVNLGRTAPITPESVDAANAYLSLSVDNGAELPQRIHLASVPYALWAQQADVATSVDGGTVDASEISINGQLIIGSDGGFLGQLSYDQLTNVPDGLDDGDDDTLAGVSCADGQLLAYQFGEWGCVEPDAHEHDASDVSSGQFPVARLPVGTTGSHVAAGDHGHAASSVTSGTFPVARLPVGTTSDTVAAGDHQHDAAAVVSGKFDVSRLPVGTSATDVAAGNHGHDAAAITSGTIAYARLPVGTTANTVKAGNAPDNDTLGGLSCTSGQIAKYNATASKWECAPDKAGGGGSLSGNWEFDEDTGTSFADTSGVGANMTLSGGGVLVGAGGHSGNALSFSSSRGVAAGANNTIPESPHVGLELWLQPDGVLNQNRTIAEKAGQFKVRQVNNAIEWTITAVNGSCTITHTVPVASDTWHHVGGWYDGLNIGVEINGNTQLAACTKGPLAPAAGSNFTIGGKLTGSTWSEAYQGEIDEVRLRPFVTQGSGYGTYGWAATPGNVPIWRWNVFRTYHNAYNGWLFGNDASLTGGQNPSNWTDGNALASSVSANKNVQRALYTRKQTGGSNGLVYADIDNFYSSTDGQVVTALFRVRNTTGSAINWTPYFYYTSYGGWNEYASVALNGANAWSTGNNCTSSGCTASVTLSIPANRTSTVVFVSTAGYEWCWYSGGNFCKRWTVLGFYNNSLTLPSGLVYVDDLDVATGGYEQ